MLKAQIGKLELSPPILLAGAYVAVGMLASSLTRNQVISFILSVMICLLLVIAGYSPVTDLLTRWTSPGVVSAVASFSVMTHFDALQRGVIDLRDVGFFLSVIGFALFGNAVIVRGLRAG
jgi:ABC-2 type transport system permease protein